MVQNIRTTEHGVAVDGYDVVSYFNGRAQMGSSDYSHTWAGATFLFASAEHQTKFIENPSRYVPEFGGYCSFGMGFGKLAAADPEAFVVQDDKLYLNASPMVLRFWRWFGSAEKSEAKWQAMKTGAGLDNRRSL